MFSNLVKTIGDQFKEIEDGRQPGKVSYPMNDCLMGGLACMYFKDPSLLEFQRRFEKNIDRSNLQTMFGVGKTPQDSQFRNILDEIAPSDIESVFPRLFALLDNSKVLERYRFIEGKYLLDVDGTGTFSSEKIDCDSCLTQTVIREKKKDRTKKVGSRRKTSQENGGEAAEVVMLEAACEEQITVRFNHQMIHGVLVHPGIKEVLPFVTEAIKNGDGKDKQDCEMNAGKRLLAKIRKDHPKLPLIFNGDGLFSKVPFVKELREHRMSFIIVAKGTDHPYLYEELEGRRKLSEIKRYVLKDAKKRKHIYEICLGLPLRDETMTKEKETFVNWFSYELINEKGKRGYFNTWVTDLEPSREIIEELVKGGRARWKAENETFNTLKKGGYHLEHNYGHGKKNLSYNFVLLILLAFLVHQIQRLADWQYQQAREKCGPFYALSELMRSLLMLVVWPSYEAMMNTVITRELKLAPI
jgi:hypothetical protein